MDKKGSFLILLHYLDKNEPIAAFYERSSKPSASARCRPRGNTWKHSSPPAGSLDAAVEDLQGYLPVQSRHSSDELFGLRVHGDSMRGRRVELHPENPDYEPIVPHPRDVTLLGKVIEVRRNLEGR